MAARQLPAFLIGLAAPEAQLRTDGVEEVTKMGPIERRARTVWNGNRLVTTWEMKTPQDPPHGCWIRFLSADGKLQTVEIRFAAAEMGEVRANRVFVRK